MQPKQRTDNYALWCEQWRERFLNMDVAELMRRLPELRQEGDSLTICQFGRKFLISLTTGEIVAADHKPAGLYEKLNIYTLFGYVQPLAYLKNEWVPFERLRNASPFSAAFQKGIVAPFCRMFNGHAQQLEQAAIALGGRKLAAADVGYEIDSFACIPMRVLFWEGDEEFPAQGNLLFDLSATDFIHVESVVTIANLGVARLAELVGIDPDRSLF